MKVRSKYLFELKFRANKMIFDIVKAITSLTVIK